MAKAIVDLNQSVTVFGIMKQHPYRSYNLFLEGGSKLNHRDPSYPDQTYMCPDRLCIRVVDVKQQFKEVSMLYFINLVRLILDNITQDKYDGWCFSMH